MNRNERLSLASWLMDLAMPTCTTTRTLKDKQIALETAIKIMGSVIDSYPSVDTTKQVFCQEDATGFSG